MLTTNLLQDRSELLALQESWRGLLERADNAEPVLTPTWALAWWRQFGEADGRSLCALSMHDPQGALVGLALLTRRTAWHRGLVPVRRLELMMTGETEHDEICSDYVGVIADRRWVREVAQTLTASLRSGALGPWDEMLWSSMKMDDPLVGEMQAALQRAGIAVRITVSDSCRYATLGTSFEEYLGGLDGPHRYEVKRGLRELGKWAGPEGYQLRRVASVDELAEGRRILEQLHELRWSDKGHSGVFASKRFAGFHDEVMPKLLAGTDGELSLSWLEVRGEAVAASYNIVYRNKVYFYQAGRKLDVPKSVKPGVCLQVLLIRDAIERGYCEYDFLAGSSQYKRHLGPSTRSLVTLSASASGLRPRLVQAATSWTELGVQLARNRLRSHKAPTAAAQSRPSAES